MQGKKKYIVTSHISTAISSPCMPFCAGPNAAFRSGFLAGRSSRDCSTGGQEGFGPDAGSPARRSVPFRQGRAGLVAIGRTASPGDFRFAKSLRPARPPLACHRRGQNEKSIGSVILGRPRPNVPLPVDGTEQDFVPGAGPAAGPSTENN